MEAPAPARPAMGAAVGAVCGFLTYWSGAAIAAASDLLQKPYESLPAEFARPLHTYTYWEMVLIAVGALLGALIARYRWQTAGVLSFVGLLSMIVGFLVYTITVSIPMVPPEERWLSYILLFGEAGGLGLIALFSFYSLDAASRRNWRRRPETVAWDSHYRPKVAFLVPVFNEDPEMVEQTIAHLVNQDYPRDHFMVLVCDDSTDKSVSGRLAAFCREVGAHHVTRPTRRGFKAGALNYTIARLDPQIEFVAVIDADYWVAPHYLRSIVGYFIDPTLSFVQTPQDYRNLNESFLTRCYKRAEAFFYHGIMLSRNEENAIIFCGTMGMLRRKAVDQIGGFAEDQICEDAEISVRLAAKGWGSLYIDQSFGKGLMPAVFEAYKKQFHRWAFGNVRILFTRAGLILRSPMRPRQKLDFLASNLHWFDGFFLFTVALVLLYIGLDPILQHDTLTHHQHELELLAVVPIALLIDGIVRLHLVLGRAGKITLGETLKVQGMWFSIKFTNMVAVTKCMLGFRTPFVRTPKHPGHRLGMLSAFVRALRLTKIETALGLALLAVGLYNVHYARVGDFGYGAYLLPFWLLLYALIFLTAPIYAYLSYRTLGSRAAARRRRSRAPARMRVHPIASEPGQPLEFRRL